jgi:hypothetical protein
MELFVPEGKEFAVKLQKSYMQRLRKEHDIETSEEYLRFLNDSDKFEIDGGVWEFLTENDISLNAFFQITPYNNQEIMYASLNPGMKSVTVDNLSSGQLADHHNANQDVEQLALHTMRHFGSYLSSGGPKKIIQAMRDSLDYLPSEGSPNLNEFVDVNTKDDFKDSYFNYVNHSRYFKLRSPDKDFVETFEKDYWRSRFAKEVEFADPTILICGCADAWKSIYDFLVDNPDSEIISHDGATIPRKYSRGVGAVPGIFEIPAEGLWVITVFHEQYSPDTDALERNLDYVNDQVTI